MRRHSLTDIELFGSRDTATGTLDAKHAARLAVPGDPR